MRIRSLLSILLFPALVIAGGQRSRGPILPAVSDGKVLDRYHPLTSRQNSLIKAGPHMVGTVQRVDPQYPFQQYLLERNLREMGSHVSDPNACMDRAGQAPFDTVYEKGYYGDRRYVFEHDPDGNVLRRTDQSRTASGWGDLARMECSYTPESRIAYRAMFVIDDEVRLTERHTYSYDSRGRLSSSRHENFDLATAQCVTAVLDSSVHDDAGCQIFYQHEYQSGNYSYGSRVITTSCTGPSGSQTWFERSPTGWIPSEKRSWKHDQVSGAYEAVTELWKGSTWVNSYRECSEGRHAEEGVQYTTWVWRDKDWVPEYRDRRMPGTDPTLEEFCCDRWNGNEWIPRALSRTRHDEQGRTTYYTSALWDNQWIPHRAYSMIYAPDGSGSMVDTSWEEGQLRSRRDVSWDFAGYPLSDQSEDWMGGMLVARYSESNSYTGCGNLTSSTRRQWWDGSWRTEERYTLTYDAESNIRSLRHFHEADTGWVLSYLSSRYDSTGSPTTWWTFDNGSQPDGWWQLQAFSELTFHYRQTSSGIDQQRLPVPTEAVLQQNYPNPFNPTTTIPFSVSSGTRTTLAVYDILGREVARPVDEWKDPGEYHVQFDASGLASGMYICRFTAGAVNLTTKMVLMR